MSGSGGGIGTGGLTSDEITADSPATWNAPNAEIGVDVPAIDIGQTTGDISVSRVPDAIPQSDMGVANGVAILGPDGKVPSSELNVSGGIQYIGDWNASTNTPALVNGTGTNGNLYKVNTAGSQDLGGGIIAFQVGDEVIYDGTQWDRIPASAAVASVNSKTGVVVITKADVGLGNVDNTSDADKPVSTAQQAALNTKVNKSGDTMSGALDMGSNKVTSLATPTNDADAATKAYVDNIAVGGVASIAYLDSDTNLDNDSPEILICDSRSGDMTVTLTANQEGKRFIIKNQTPGGRALHIDPGSSSIDDNSSVITMDTPYHTISIVFQRIWRIISRYPNP